MRGYRWIVIGTVLLAGAGIVVAARGRAVPVRIIHASRSPLVVPVDCPGVLQPPPGGELRAAAGGLVGEIFVKEGERVRRGAALLRIDAPELSAQAASARQEWQQLREERAVAEAEQEGARKEAAYRRHVLEGDARLVQESALAPAAYDADELALRQAEARLRATEARLGSIVSGSGPRGSRLDLAAARARELDERLAALTVRAPADGAVYGLPHRMGEAIGAGQVVANVTDPGRPSLRLQVDPSDVPRLAVGQRVLVTFEGLPGQWEGRIDRVGPALRALGSREVGDVVGTLSDPGGALPYNAAVNAKIIVGERDSALLLPRAALHREGDKRFVYLALDGRALRREVTLGLVGPTDVELLSGLSEADAVALPGDVPLSEGLRIARQ